MYEAIDGAGAFLGRRGSDEFLFHLRDDIPGIADRDMWSLVGGGIDEDESPEQTVRREVLEEIGLELGALRFLAEIDAVDDVDGERFPLRLSLFLAEIDVDAEDIDLKEGQEVRYFSLERIMAENLKPEIKRFILDRRDDLERNRLD